MPDDETINQYLARSEEEFELMQGMDLERRRAEARDVNRQPRLIEESELPTWLVKDEEEVIIVMCFVTRSHGFNQYLPIWIFYQFKHLLEVI